MMNFLVGVARGLLTIAIIVCVIISAFAGSQVAGHQGSLAGFIIGGVAGFIVSAILFGAIAAIFDIQKSMRTLVDLARSSSQANSKS